MSAKDKERLAAALRENLRRRKAQARELGGGTPRGAEGQTSDDPGSSEVREQNN